MFLQVSLITKCKLRCNNHYNDMKRTLSTFQAQSSFKAAHRDGLMPLVLLTDTIYLIAADGIDKTVISLKARQTNVELE